MCHYKRIARCGVLLVTLLFITGCGKSPDSVVKEFYDLANKGQTDVAMETLFTSDLRQGIAFMGGLSGVGTNDMVEKGSISKVSVTECEIDGKRAEVTVEIKYKDGAEGEDSYTLIRSDNKWLISDVSF